MYSVKAGRKRGSGRFENMGGKQKFKVFWVIKFRFQSANFWGAIAPVSPISNAPA
jgi:hypothetical protein